MLIIKKIDGGISKIMWLSVSCLTKYKFYLEYKSIDNFAIFKLFALIIINSKVFKSLEKHQTNKYLSKTLLNLIYYY